jgi:hypothetical protein
MNLTNYYWYFQSAIPHRICDDIVNTENNFKNKWQSLVVMVIKN